MKRHIRRKQALALFCLCVFAGHSGTAAASSEYTTANNVFHLHFLDEGEADPTGEIGTSTYTLSAFQKQSIALAAERWSYILRDGKRLPLHILVATEDDRNAFGGTFISKDLPREDGIYPTRSYTMLMTETPSSQKYGGFMVIGKGMFPPTAPETDPWTPLPQEDGVAFHPATFHEFGHVMGMVGFFETTPPHFPSALFTFQRFLYDHRGVRAKPNLAIKTDNYQPDSDEYFDLPGFHGNLDGRQRLPYFYGPEVARVLAGAQLEAYDAHGYPIGQRVPGIPLNGNEGKPGDQDNLSQIPHSELRNSLMSHQRWRNYNTFMELELAIFQDLGYSIDRRDFFGRSIYGNDQEVYNTAPYAARTADHTDYIRGAYSRTPWGMGLHIYGSRNRVTQAADLLTEGAAAVGIRVDGVKNDVDVAGGTTIRADGKNGNGLLVAYGRDHRLTLRPDSRVTALGHGGIGAAFDFGTNLMGKNGGARASYAAFSKNIELIPAAVAMNGPLVSDFTVQGTLIGRRAAIYMSDNAYVKNITVGTGAHIEGDIINKWQYDDSDISDTRMLRRLEGAPLPITTLTFAGQNLRYNGNIDGSKNTRLIISGDLSYGGKADVLSAAIAPGGALFGGHYRLYPAPGHTLSVSLAGDPHTLSDVGVFTNRGLLAPVGEPLTIEGDFVSSGTFGLATGADGSAAHPIAVSGTANVDGSALTALPGQVYRPDTSYTFLTATGGVTGAMIGEGAAFSGFLGISSYRRDADAYRATFTPGNYLGALDSRQQMVFHSLAALWQRTDAEGQSQIGRLYSLSGDAGRQALTALADGSSSDVAAAAFARPLVRGALAARQSYLSHGTRIPLSLRPLRYQGGFGSPGLVLPVEMAASSGLWLRTGRTWSEIGGTSGQGYTLSLGYDRPISPRWMLGGLFSYSRECLSREADKFTVRDHRLALYGIYRNGPHDGWLTISFGRQENDGQRVFFAPLFTAANSRYHSTTVELAGRYSYDLDDGREGVWHNKPFVAADLIHYRQSGFRETGAGVWNQSLDSAQVTYSDLQLGCSWERDFSDDGFVTFDVGWKGILSGHAPDVAAHLSAAPAYSFHQQRAVDRARFTMNLCGSKDIGSGWHLSGEAGLEKGAHDHIASAMVNLNREW